MLVLGEQNHAILPLRKMLSLIVRYPTSLIVEAAAIENPMQADLPTADDVLLVVFHAVRHKDSPEIFGEDLCRRIIDMRLAVFRYWLRDQSSELCEEAEMSQVSPSINIEH